MKEINKDALSYQIADHITEEIISGKIKSGEKLVESKFADTYGISRAPIRDAFYILIMEGLVEKLPRKGTIVREYSHTEIVDFLDMRNVLESMAMRRIAEKGIDRVILDEMSALLPKMRNAKEFPRYTRLNYNFHDCLITMSKSTVIAAMYHRLGSPLMTIQNATFSKKGKIKKSLKEHEQMVTHLRTENFGQAKALLSQHNEDVLSEYLRDVSESL